MADDELVLPIEKAFWPKGVMRGLTTVLRTLGDRHGNLVIVAQPLKGTIMVKGPADKIEGVKPELREVIEEHFPDADVPEELLPGGAGGGHESSVPIETAPEEEAHVPRETVPASEALPAAPMAPVKPITGARRPRASLLASSDLLWECVQRSSSFIRKPTRDLQRTFSAEPVNLMGLHSRKYSGLVAKEALDIRPVKKGVKEAIELIQSPSKPTSLFHPRSSTVTMGLKKCPKKGLSQIDCELAAKFYRRDLHSIARTKYLKVQRSFKTRRPTIKTRRAKK